MLATTPMTTAAAPEAPARHSHPDTAEDKTSKRRFASYLAAIARRTRRALGFTRSYNCWLFILCAGAFTGFALARLMYLDIPNIFCSGTLSPIRHASPGECFYYRTRKPTPESIGILLHLSAVLPSSLLVIFQFIPSLRRWRGSLLHRVNGRLVLLLSAVSCVGALMVARRAFGGSLASQTAVGFVSVSFLGSLGMAWLNIRRLQVEQHRAWMLRAWLYAGSIVTMRIIMFLAAHIITLSTTTSAIYFPEPCGKLASLLSANATVSLYPSCAPYFTGQDPDAHAVVRASMRGGAEGRPERIGAALDAGFGGAFWLAWALHAVGVEIYLQLTPAEHERLRNVSYQRQLEAGLPNPGRAGFTADRFGDAELWRPATATNTSTRRSSRRRSRSRSSRRGEEEVARPRESRRSRSRSRTINADGRGDDDTGRSSQLCRQTHDGGEKETAVSAPSADQERRPSEAASSHSRSRPSSLREAPSHGDRNAAAPH